MNVRKERHKASITETCRKKLHSKEHERWMDNNAITFKPPYCLIEGLLISPCSVLSTCALNSEKGKRGLESPTLRFQAHRDTLPHWPHHPRLALKDYKLDRLATTTYKNKTRKPWKLYVSDA
jgi:hypothetical protein